MHISDIIKKCKYGEFDYNFLLDLLSEYQNPRQKITYLLKNNYIIRVKKGLYVFGLDQDAPPYSLEVLANIIYGPSYISKYYALMLYGLIPERVEEVTSVTTKRNKIFNTPVGSFSYSHLKKDRYVIGKNRYYIGNDRYTLVATKEKAITDIIFNDKEITSTQILHIFLTENMRIDEEELVKLDKDHVNQLANIFNTKPVFLFNKLLEELK